MNENLIRFSFNAPLNPGDTETQTYGCRQNNPDICSSNSMQGRCAFVTEDNICHKPSRAWKKQFHVLSDTNE